MITAGWLMEIWRLATCGHGLQRSSARRKLPVSDLAERRLWGSWWRRSVRRWSGRAAAAAERSWWGCDCASRRGCALSRTRAGRGSSRAAAGPDQRPPTYGRLKQTNTLSHHVLSRTPNWLSLEITRVLFGFLAPYRFKSKSHWANYGRPMEYGRPLYFCPVVSSSIYLSSSPSGHHRTTLSGYIFATKARIDNPKKLLNSNISPHFLTIWWTSAH